MNYRLESAGRYLGREWEVLACRPGKRGELIYMPAYDRIAPLPDDSSGCCVVVEPLPGFEDIAEKIGR